MGADAECLARGERLRASLPTRHRRGWRRKVAADRRVPARHTAAGDHHREDTLLRRRGDTLARPHRRLAARRPLMLDRRAPIGVTEIALSPLDAAETATLASRLIDGELEVDTAMRIYRETEGNPLFIVETMRAAMEHGAAAAERAHNGNGD